MNLSKTRKNKRSLRRKNKRSLRRKNKRSLRRKNKRSLRRKNKKCRGKSLLSRIRDNKNMIGGFISSPAARHVGGSWSIENPYGNFYKLNTYNQDPVGYLEYTA